jgi:hypothetical protein
MGMVGHQRVGMQGATLLYQGLAEPVQVSMVVLFRKEAGLAVMAALHDVQRDAVQVDARAAGQFRVKLFW